MFATKKLKLFNQYKRDRADGKCYIKYYQYGFVDYMFDGCQCPECSRYSDANDIVDNKPDTVSAESALLKEGFTKDEVIKYLDIFDDLGIFTVNEIAGIQEITG